MTQLQLPASGVMLDNRPAVIPEGVVLAGFKEAEWVKALLE